MSKIIQTAEWKNTARLYALIAPKSPKAVVLRRGPSNHVRMISWDLKTDRFTPGQWLKHRVYERRCDLSPDGRYFIYFASNYAKEISTYSAISKPPFFTALAFWPQGDTWGGGGLFSENGRTLYLNHGRSIAHDKGVEAQFARLPLCIKPLREYSGCGEDDPIRTYRMLRDGWTLAQKGTRSKSGGRDAPYGYVKPQATIFDKRPQNKGASSRWSLQLSSKYTAERQGRWNVEEAGIFDSEGKPVLNIGRVDWCDLDDSGDILWAWVGKLWRLEFRRSPHALKLAQPKMLADFNDMVFEQMKAPAEFSNW